MQKKILVILLCLTLLIPVGVSAQSEVKLSQLQIDFWPEYDAPGVLVIYNMTLSADTALPSSVRFSIPANSDLVAVAMGGQSGGLVNAEFEIETIGAFDVLTIQTDSLVVHFEYYDNELTLNGPDRTFNFKTEIPYAVDQLRYNLQVPFDAIANELGGDAANATVSRAADGLDYALLEVGAVPAGFEVDYTFEYTRPSNALFVDVVAQGSSDDEPSAEPQKGASALIEDGNLLTWVLLLVGVVILGFAGYNFYKLQKEDDTPKRAHRGSRSGGGSANRFCHSCGEKANSSDKYCRECGTELR